MKSTVTRGGRACLLLNLAGLLGLAGVAFLTGCEPADGIAPIRVSVQRIPLDGLGSSATPEIVQVVYQPPGGPRFGTTPRVGIAPLAPPTEPAPVETSPIEPALPAAPGLATERSKMFAGWGKPECVLVLTGNQSGYIEPCGCTGLANQKGGLSRRHTLVKELRERGWPVVPIDAGNQVRRIFRQAEIKFQMTVEAFRQIGYDAVTFGPDDLLLNSDDLLTQSAAIGGGETMFVDANVSILSREMTARFKIIERGKHRIGVTGFIGDSLLKGVDAAEILKEKPEEGVKLALDALRAGRCDTLVLLAQGTIDESKAVAAKFPEFQIVVTTGGGGEPEFLPTSLNGGRTLLIQTGAKGMYVGVIGIFPGTTTTERYKYERVALDARFTDSPEMLKILADYQNQLRLVGFTDLGIKPLPHPSGHTFVGSQKCGECHTTALAIWENSKHAHALKTLVHPGERTEIPRHFDPECLSCHVTGWNPQRYYPYKSGYLSREKTPEMEAVGCENCHGPGAQHVAAEEGTLPGGADVVAKYRLEMQLPLAKAETTCLECHDHDNSPDFHEPGAFREYWDQIKHYGKD